MPNLQNGPSHSADPGHRAAVHDFALELERAYSETRRSEEGLRSVVHDFVVELRASGATPEAAVVAVKSALRAPSVTPMRVLTIDPLTSRVVNWCIEEYFKGE